MWRRRIGSVTFISGLVRSCATFVSVIGRVEIIPNMFQLGQVQFRHQV